MAHVAPAKKEIVERLVKRFEGSEVIGIANIRGIPAPQFQAIRKKLAGRAQITVAKNNLLQLALKEAEAKKRDLGLLIEAIDGQSAVVTAAINPFRLFRELEATKTKAPARGGEVAPDDLWVREGETPFKPGPIVGELQKAGVPAAIERGKVVVKKDKLLVKAGDRIPREVAQVLAKLEIYPLTVGLELRGAYESGTVFRRDVLAVDDLQVRGQIATAGRQALALALEIAYPTRMTVPLLLARAHGNALTLAIESEFPTRESIKFLLAKAQAEMLALASRVPEAADEDLKAKLASPGTPPPPPSEAKPEDKKEKKEVSEDEAAAGLGSLFG
jgi:large subunit ribosomal protein L10